MPYLTSIERAALAEGLEKGREEGLEMGLEMGREEGREEGRELELKRLIAKTWSVRFGEVPPTLSARLESLSDLARLDELFDVSLTATMPEIEQRLA